MSLINDALKRASQRDKSHPRQTETHASMKPAAEERSSSPALALGAGVVLALVLAGWFFWQWWNTSHPPASAKVEHVAAIAPKPAPAPVVQEIIPPLSAPAPTSTPAPAPAPAPPAKAVEQTWPADLKLMAIFFRQTNPLALINGKTLGVGDLIDGIRVTKIERDRVSVEWNGQVKELMTN
jgi:hypothetical protein